MLTIDWKPERKTSIPMFKQIAQYIKDKISYGEWPVGTLLPPQRQLAKVFEVNRSTISTALEELTADGLLEGRIGQGTKVINNSWSMLASNSPPDWNSYLQKGIHHPNYPIIQEINRSEFKENIIRLGTGELSPELFPKAMLEKILQELSHSLPPLGYLEPKGLLPLRQEISLYLKEKGINVSPSSILITSGALQALQLIGMGLLNPGSTVLLEKPSYLYSLQIFQSLGMNLLGIPLDQEGIQAKMLGGAKRGGRSILLYTIPSFHNPTGIVMSQSRREELLAVCEKERIPIIEDDVYRELWLDSPSPEPLKSLDQKGLVLYLGSLSKTLSPGLRVGWLVGPEPVIERLADIKMQTDYGASSLSQWAAFQFISSGLYNTYLIEVREKLRVRRTITLEVLKKHFGDFATWSVPQGGFYIWLKLNKSISMPELFRNALKENILLNPGILYSSFSNGYLRLSYAYAPLEQLKNGLIFLAKIIKSML